MSHQIHKAKLFFLNRNSGLYGSYCNMAQKVIEGGMFYVKSYALDFEIAQKVIEGGIFHVKSYA